MTTLIIIALLVGAGIVIGALIARNNKKQTEVAAQKLSDLAKEATAAAEKALKKAKK